MWYIASFVRGMSVDEAVKQLSFLKKKGAAIAKEVILEAQNIAVEEHDIEFKSNLWVGQYINIDINILIIKYIQIYQQYYIISINFLAESFATKGAVIKGMRRHARGRSGTVHYRHTHYFVRLEEGKPPKHYYLPAPKSGEELLKEWMEQMHHRKIYNSL